MQERGRRRGPPGEQAAGALQVFRRPQLVVDDAVHVGVVPLAAALGGAADVGEIIAMLSELAERLRPESPGPIRRQLDQARKEP
jgi:hypothetical protein